MSKPAAFADRDDRELGAPAHESEPSPSADSSGLVGIFALVGEQSQPAQWDDEAISAMAGMSVEEAVARIACRWIETLKEGTAVLH